MMASAMKAVLLLLGSIFSSINFAEAQQADKLHRIGFVVTTTADSSLPQQVLRSLRGLGYIEGQNILVEIRDKVAELVKLKVDVIVVFGTSAALAAKKATSTIPIVMTSSGDPVRSGLIASLAQPGGNVTGLTSLSVQLGGKRLELLKDIVPGLSRVIIPAPASSLTEESYIKEIGIPARELKVHLIRFPVRGPEDYEEIFRVASKEAADGLLTRLPTAFTSSINRKQLVDLAAKNRLPAMYEANSFVEAGGLMAYGIDLDARTQRVAIYVDKILKGANPADLPVEQPTKFQLVINLKAAKQIGLTIPPNVLARADKVIK
jgi:putative tryptophan/tyrosine transport system substrate-binding protein